MLLFDITINILWVCLLMGLSLLLGSMWRSKQLKKKDRQIAELEKEHAELQDKIAERAAKYGLRLQDMENFAFSIMAATDGWLSLQDTKDQIEHTLTDLIINAHPEQR